MEQCVAGGEAQSMATGRNVQQISTRRLQTEEEDLLAPTYWRRSALSSRYKAVAKGISQAQTVSYAELSVGRM